LLVGWRKGRDYIEEASHFAKSVTGMKVFEINEKVTPLDYLNVEFLDRLHVLVNAIVKWHFGMVKRGESQARIEPIASQTEPKNSLKSHSSISTYSTMIHTGLYSID